MTTIPPKTITASLPEVEIFFHYGDRVLYRRIKASDIKSTLMPDEGLFTRPKWLFEIQGIILEQRNE